MRDKFPVIQTERLYLRPFELTDAIDVQLLAGDRAVADTTLRIPHPYEDGMAEEWISMHRRQMAAGEAAVFAIVLRQEKKLIGAIGLTIDQDAYAAEIGYWIGKQYWNNGYCTDASKAILEYAFEKLGLNTINAVHMTRNPASGRVMRKLGMTHGGSSQRYSQKWNRYENVENYRILRSDWMKKKHE